MICDEHGEFECLICFSSNPHWNSAKQEIHLAPRAIRMVIQGIKAAQGVLLMEREGYDEGGVE